MKLLDVFGCVCLEWGGLGCLLGLPWAPSFLHSTLLLLCSPHPGSCFPTSSEAVKVRGREVSFASDFPNRCVITVIEGPRHKDIFVWSWGAMLTLSAFPLGYEFEKLSVLGADTADWFSGKFPSRAEPSLFTLQSFLFCMCIHACMCMVLLEVESHFQRYFEPT